MKYLLDECVYGLPTSWNHVMRVIDILGPGTKDNEIRKFAIKHGYTIVTVDKGLALSMVIRNKPVVFRCKAGTFFINGNAEKNPKNFDPILARILNPRIVVYP